MQRGCSDKGTRRVIRISQEQHAGVGPDGGKQRIEIIAKMLGGYFNARRADRLRRQRVNRKRVLRINGRRARRHKRARGQFQYIVRAVAKNNLRWLDAKFPRDHRLQREAAAIGI